MWKPTHRNMDNIQFERYRKKVDDKFNQMHDELSDCYYNYWKKGVSKPFNAGSKTYDVQETPEKSKVLFDKLHGLIFHQHQNALEKHHREQPQDKRDEKFELRVVKNERRQEKLERRNNFIQKMKSEGVQIDR